MTKPPSPRPSGLELIAAKYLFDALFFLLMGLILVSNDSKSGILLVFISRVFGLALAIAVVGLGGGEFSYHPNLFLPLLLACLIASLLLVWLARNLWRMSQVARRVAIALESCGLGWWLYIAVTNPTDAYVIFSLPSVGVCVFIILYLLKRKAAFGKPRTTPPFDSRSEVA